MKVLNKGQDSQYDVLYWSLDYNCHRSEISLLCTAGIPALKRMADPGAQQIIFFVNNRN